MIRYVGMPCCCSKAVQFQWLFAHRIDLDTVDRADAGHLRTISKESSRRCV